MNLKTCIHIPDDGLRCVIWNTRGLAGSPTSPQLSRERKHNYITRLAKNNDIICLQEIHGKHEFLQTTRVYAPKFRLCGTFIPNNLNASGTAICIRKNLLPEGAIISHTVTCQGRDHIVNIRSGACNLVVVNVRFEPALTLVSLRERLHIWHLFPEALRVITGVFNICESQEGRFNLWNQTFTDGDAVKAALFCSFFPSLTGTTRTLSRIDRAFVKLLMAEARDFHCYCHVLENRERSIPSDHAAVRVVIQKPTTRCDQDTRSKLDVQTSLFLLNFETD